MEETTVNAMFDAIGSVFEQWATPEIMERFRASMRAIGHQCFVEGALRTWMEISDERRGDSS